MILIDLHTLTKPCVHNERRWWWGMHLDSFWLYSYSLLCTMRIGSCQRKTQKKWIHLGESSKQTHCALWDLAIWWRVFWLAASASPHPSVKLGAKVTHKDAFVASSTARRILPTPDLSHHFRIWALHLLMAVLGSNSNHTSKEMLTQEKIWLGVAGLLYI